MRGLFISLIAITAIMLVSGCGKKDEGTTTPPPSTTTTGGTPTTTTTPSADDMPSAAMPDFSSDEKATATVAPYLQEQFTKEPLLAGTSLKVEVKDKTVHIMGEVKNNDQKRKIDEITKMLDVPANAAGYKFMNMAIVKG